jgi:hypothetical protein
LLNGNEECVEFLERSPDPIGTTKDLRSSQGTFIRQLTDWPFKETAGILRPPKNGGLRMTRGRLLRPQTADIWLHSFVHRKSAAADVRGAKQVGQSLDGAAA